MATVYKSGSRKALGEGPFTSIGYGNYAVPGMREHKHLSIHIHSDESHQLILRFSFSEVERIWAEYQRIKDN